MNEILSNLALRCCHILQKIKEARIQESNRFFLRFGTVVLSLFFVFVVASVSASIAFAHSKEAGGDTEAPRVESVTVVEATTVKVTFNEAVADHTTDVSMRHFYVDHPNADTPHTHEVSAVALSSDKKTAILTLARALHPEVSMPLYIVNVADLSGNLLSDKETIKYRTN